MSVTAVPLHPIKKGSLTKFWLAMILVLVVAIGLAFIGTRKQQVTTTPSGLVYRVVEEGTGEPATAADLVMLDLEIRKADGTLVGSTAQTGQPTPIGVTEPFPGLGELVTQMRQGGIYEARINAQSAVGGSAPIPPGGPVSATDMLQFRLRAVAINRGGAAQRAMGLGGQGGPGGPAGASGQQMTPEQLEQLQRMIEEGSDPHAAPGGPGAGRPSSGAAPSGPPAGTRGATPPRGGQSTPAPGNSAGGR